MNITPEQARKWRDDARPGPWYAHTNPDDPDETFIYDEDGHMCIAVEPAGSDYREADLHLAAAAPDLAQTIAAQTWEYGVEYLGRVTHWGSREFAENDLEEYLEVGVFLARLVRRLVGPVEVAE